MKVKSLFLMAAFIASVMVLSLPASAQGMNGNGSGPPDQDMEPKGPGPAWDQDSGQGDLDKGLNYRYGKGSPSASIENENGDNGLSVSLKSIRTRNGSADLTGDLAEAEWSVDEKNSSSGKEVAYQSEVGLKNTDGAIKHISSFKMVFSYKWGDEKKAMDLEMEVLDPPENASVELELSLDSIGIDKDLHWDRMGEERRGHSFRFIKGADQVLCELNMSKEALVRNGSDITSIPTEIELSNMEESGLISISAAFTGDAGSIETSGTLVFLDALLDDLIDAGENAATFVLDHIISFSIGAAILIVMVTGSLLLLSRKRKDTGGSELDLSNNRYFRKDQ